MKFLTTDYSSSNSVGSYRIDSNRRIRIEEYRGCVELGDIKSIQSSMVSDPCWSPEFHGLVDFTDAELNLSANDVLRLALILRHGANRSTGWLTFVAVNSSTYGMVRMLGHWSRNTDRMKIFPTREQADLWLAENIDQMPVGFIREDMKHVTSAFRQVG